MDTKTNPIIPMVDFNVSAAGITVLSQRLETPKFIPFDQTGRCKNCKSDQIDIDFLITTKGLTFFTNRIKSPKFVSFDHIYDFPDECYFRLKSRGKIFQIPFKEKENFSISKEKKIAMEEEEETENKKAKLEPISEAEEKTIEVETSSEIKNELIESTDDQNYKLF